MAFDLATFVATRQAWRQGVTEGTYPSHASVVTPALCDLTGFVPAGEERPNVLGIYQQPADLVSGVVRAQAMRDMTPADYRRAHAEAAGFYDGYEHSRLTRFNKGLI